MKKSVLALLLAVLMTVTLLTIGASASSDAPTMQATDLLEKLEKATSGSTVQLTGNVVVSNEGKSVVTDSVIVVPEGVTLDGNGYSITASSNWQLISGKQANHIVGLKDGATIKNVTIIGNKNTKSGIHVYRCTGVVIDTVTIEGCGNAGMIVNGSTVTATKLNTSDNAWGGVNVDQGSGVTSPANFNLTSGNIEEYPKIWSENESKGNITYPSDWVELLGSKYSDFAPVDDLGPGAIYNENQETYYRGFDYALNRADTGNTLVLLSDVVDNCNFKINKDITLVSGTYKEITFSVDVGARARIFDIDDGCTLTIYKIWRIYLGLTPLIGKA